MRLRVGPAFLTALLSFGIASAQQYQAFVLQSPDTVQTLANGAAGSAGAGLYFTFTSGANGGLFQRALYWPDLSGTAVDLNPSSAVYSYANSMAGFQVGGAFNSPATNGGEHAALWLDGTPDNFVDLDPPGFNGNYSAVLGMDGSTQVGYARQNLSGPPFIFYHPILWSGNALSAVDLLPNLPGVTHAIAAGCGGGQQVGWVVFNDSTHPFVGIHSHAFLWNSTAASAQDLHPAAFVASAATGTDGTQQVGYGIDGTFTFHALLWTGSADSVVDLTPADAFGARAFSCKNGYQVGYIVTADGQHAAIWNGTADSVIDLDAVSGSGFNNAVATGIDDNGNVVGYTDFGLLGSYAVMWSPIKAVNHAPTAVAGPDQTVQAQGAGTPVTLDGSASSDPDTGDTLSYQWTDENNNVVGTSAVVNLSLPMGAHTFTLVVTDNHGAASSPSVTHVNVVDTTPPTISGLRADPSVLSNHDRRKVRVTVSYSLSDNADPSPGAKLSIASSDPRDNDDAGVIDAHHVWVKVDCRDERQGRVYTITVTATDHSGNSASQNVTVSLPPERHRR